jgi:hypothetical protein
VTDPAIEARVGALRARGLALRTRPRKEIVDRLAQVLDRWRDPGSPWRVELLERLPDATGFGRESIHEGLERALADWRGDALRLLVERELGSDPRTRHTGFAVTALLLAGSIPMPTLLAMLGPLVLGSPLLVRAASRDRVTAGLVRRSIAEVDPELGACIEEVHFDHADEDALEAFLETDCTVAYGSDPTIASIARRLPPSRRLVPHPHRLSLGVLGDAATRGSELDQATTGLALDTALWDQQGCLSPIALFVVSAATDAADRVTDALAHALSEAQARWPRGRVAPAAASVIAQERDTALLRESAGGRVRVAVGNDGSWTLVRESDLEPRAVPLHRFLRVHPVADASELARAIAPYARHLAGVAHAGLDADAIEVLVRSGASRLCTPGTLQCPPLAWHHDGMPVLTPMSRITDVEGRRG